jgi:hypothetical protein
MLFFLARTRSVGYVPDGMTPDQYKKLKQKEQEDAKLKKFGAFGPQSFKSRSLQSFQKDLEAGKAGHLMPVFNAKEKLKAGQLREKDIPYMQRLGAWDDSDIRGGGGKKKAWRSEDEKYNANAAPPSVDWMGRNQRSGGPARASPANSSNNNKAKKSNEQPKKKLFGMF